MQSFIPGLDLAGHFYHEAVCPVLDKHFPQLAHSAARLDFGSDVLGFDTPRSTDHDWGPKLTLFLSEEDYLVSADQVGEALAWELPFEVRGYSTHFCRHADGTRNLTATNRHPVDHAVTVTMPALFFRDYLGINPSGMLSVADWLAIPQQRLRTVASGRVFCDGLKQLEPARQTLRWYPHDIWLYLLANQWRRIDQEEPFMARCGEAGDESGSRLIAARLAHELMRLCFLMERQYMPYAKWFGTAFMRLNCAGELLPLFAKVLDAGDWQTREKRLTEAYSVIMRLHNVLGVTPPLDPYVVPFHSRPYLVSHAGRFVEALQCAIQSDLVKQLPPFLGSIDQFVDSTDVLESIEHCRRLVHVACHYG